MFCTLINSLVYVPSKHFSNCFDIVHFSEPHKYAFNTSFEQVYFCFGWDARSPCGVKACFFLISKSFLLDDIYDPRYLF